MTRCRDLKWFYVEASGGVCWWLFLFSPSFKNKTALKMFSKEKKSSSTTSTRARTYEADDVQIYKLCWDFYKLKAKQWKLNLLALTGKLLLAEIPSPLSPPPRPSLLLLPLWRNKGMRKEDGSILSPWLGVRSELKMKKIIYKNLFIVDVLSYMDIFEKKVVFLYFFSFV